MLAEMIAEVLDYNRRIHDLDTTIKNLVAPPAPTLLDMFGITHIRRRC
ncbi:hypothetical protein [Nocardia sp. NPDC004750]